MQFWVHRYTAEGTIDAKRPGPKAIAYTDANPLHRNIVATYSADGFATTRNTAIMHDVSMTIVRRHLRAAKIKCRKPAKKILLTALHKEERMRFARKFIDFDWCNNIVIFSDEKCFKSDKDGRKILWRKDGERYHQKNILPCRSSGRITLGYWGWMSSMGPGELVEVGGRNTSQGYLDILQNVMLPTVRVAYPDEHIYFVHDNCSVHRARMVQDWLSVQENLTVIEWPSKSPDLNPIENLWGHMVLNWDSSDVRSKRNLDNLVSSMWESFRGTDLCENLVASMRTRLQEVIDNEGAPIRY